MAYNDSNRGKGRPAGTRGGVKKYPADRNFGGADRNPGGTDRKPFRGNRDGADKKPYYGNKTNEDRKPYYGGKANEDRKPYYGNKAGEDKKPYRGNRDNADRKPYAAKGNAGWDRKPRQDRKKEYDRIPPRDTSVKSQETAEAAAADEAEADGEDYDPTAGLVIGRSAVRELLRSGRTVDKLLVHRGEREGSIVMLVAEAIEQGIPVVEVDKAKLDEMAGFVPHQGVIAMVAAHAYATVDEILENAKSRGEAPLIVICDELSDPHNLGAIIRTAECAGAHGVIIPKRRSVGLTAVVGKASAGALEYLPVARVANLVSAIHDLQKAGVWVFGTAADGNTALYQADLNGPAAIVIGNEGDGMSRLVAEACDFKVSIPMRGRISSLNASNAAAILLYEAVRQRG